MRTRSVLCSSLQDVLQTLTVAVILLGLFTSMWEPVWAADSASTASPASASSTTTEPARAHEASKPVPSTKVPDMPGQQTSAQSSPAPNLSAANQMLRRQGPVFIENRGQFDPRVKFLVKGNGANLWLTNEGIVFDFQRQTSKPSPDATKETREALNPFSRGRASFDPRLKSDQTPMERLVFKQKLVSANPNPMIEAHDPQPGIYNYFIGSDPDKWRTHVLGYKEVVYRDIWKGVDLKLFANGPNLEEEFIVHPGADLSSVQLAYEGIKALSVADDGSLKVTTNFGEVIETSPRVYQEIAGERLALSGSFKVGAQNSYAFEVAKRDGHSDLIIDPTVILSKTQPRRKADPSGSLLYSTYLGGSATCNGFCGPLDYARGIAVDASGSAYVGGTTASQDFPTTAGAYLQHDPGGTCGFITKFTPLGNQLQYSTYLCGVSGAAVFGIGVDSSGDAYVTGLGYSDFPTTPNALQQYVGGIFMTVLSPNGDALLYSTGFGYNDGFEYTSYGPKGAHPIAVDSLGRAYLTGTSSNGCKDGWIPTTLNAFQSSYAGCNVAFLGVLDPTQSGQASLIYGSYLGGSAQDWGTAVTADAYGMAYVTGKTFSSDFPVTKGAYQTTPGGAPGTEDAFVAKFNPRASASTLIYSTYLGGNQDDESHAIAVDSLGNAYISGFTDSDNFPTTAGALIGQLGINSGFVTKLNAAGNNLIFSTFWGGAYPVPNSVDAIAVDSFGNAYVAGTTGGQLLVSSDAYQSSPQGIDAFVSKFDPSGTILIYSSYLGGIDRDVGLAVAVDVVGDAYVAGWTRSTNFPVTQAAFQQQLNGTDDAFVTKFPLGGSGTLSITGIVPNAGGNAGSVTARVIGTGFHNGATAKLACGQSNVPGNNPTVTGGGQIITATFDLTKTAPGVCDVVVTNADNNAVTLPKAFTVQQGGAFDLLVQKIGTAALPGANMKYSISLANLGNIDAAPDVAVTETVEPWFAFQGSTPPVETIIQADKLWPPSDLGTGAKFDEVLEWNISSLPARSVRNFVYGVQLDRSTPVGLKVSGPACASNIRQAQVFICATGFVACMAVGALECSPLTPFPVLYAACLIGKSFLCSVDFHDCLDVINKWCDLFEQGVESPPRDPNYLIGSSGTGDQRWVRSIQPLNYAVHFENDPQAQTPAQVVIVATPLDMDLDLSSLQLSDIAVAGYPIPISPIFSPRIGADEFASLLDLRPAQNLFARIDVKLDPTARTLTWTFTSIDPTTGQPPADPSVGILPPGAEGFVSFTAGQSSGSSTGTVIQDQSNVVFGNSGVLNPPVYTNLWANTVDATAPVSHVLSLAPSQTCVDFKVNWSASDVGAGVQNLTVYVSDSGANFVPWLTNTTLASSIFQGQVGHTYGFYSIATDLVGNVEPGKSAAEASTQVTANNSCGPPNLSGTASVNSYSQGILSLNLQLSDIGTADALNVMINQLTFRTLSGSGKVTLASPTLPISVGNIPVDNSSPVTLTLNVPTTVTKFSITESGTMQDSAGKKYNYSIGQVVVP